MNREQRKFLEAEINQLHRLNNRWGDTAVIDDPPAVKKARAIVNAYTARIDKAEKERCAKFKIEIAKIDRELTFGDANKVLAMIDKIKPQIARS